MKVWASSVGTPALILFCTSGLCLFSHRCWICLLLKSWVPRKHLLGHSHPHQKTLIFRVLLSLSMLNKWLWGLECCQWLWWTLQSEEMSAVLSLDWNQVHRFQYHFYLDPLEFLSLPRLHYPGPSNPLFFGCQHPSFPMWLTSPSLRTHHITWCLHCASPPRWLRFDNPKQKSLPLLNVFITYLFQSPSLLKSET